MRTLIKPLVRSNFRSTIKNALEPVINYVARLGDGQYWQLSGGGITIPSGGSMEFEFIAPDDSYGGSAASFFDNANRDRFRVLGGVYNIAGCSVYVDGLQVFSGDNPVIDGLRHAVRVEPNQLMNILIFGASFTGVDSSVPAPLFGLSIYDENDTLINEIPLTNKAQGATQLPTVGNVSATMIGYTPDVWEEVKKLWYNKTTGLVDCNYGLIECNEELITCH